MRARLGPEWLRVYARARVRRAGRKRGFAPRRRSKLRQFLNSRSPGQRHDPPKPRASMPFGKVSAGFATVLRREPSPRYTSAEDPHRGGQLGLWCSPMCTPIRWTLRGIFMGKTDHSCQDSQSIQSVRRKRWRRGWRRAESSARCGLRSKSRHADCSSRSTRLPHPVTGSFRDLARLRSDAKAREVAFRVAQPGCGARREHTGEHLRCIGGHGKRRGRGVLFEAAHVARAGNWYDKRILRQQPGKR